MPHYEFILKVKVIKSYNHNDDDNDNGLLKQYDNDSETKAIYIEKSYSINV